MTAQTLPDDPNYCFVPAYDIEDEVQQIRIVIEGMSGYVPTALVALTIKKSATNLTAASDSPATTGPHLPRRPCAPRPPNPTTTPSIEPETDRPLLRSRPAVVWPAVV